METINQPAIAGLGVLLTFKQVSQRAIVSEITARRWTKRQLNPLPVIRLGYNTLRVSEVQLAEWLASHRKDGGK